MSVVLSRSLLFWVLVIAVIAVLVLLYFCRGLVLRMRRCEKGFATLVALRQYEKDHSILCQKCGKFVEKA